MNIKDLEKEIIAFLLSHTRNNKVIENVTICHFYAGRDIRLEPEKMAIYSFDEKRVSVLDIFDSLARYKAGQGMTNILLHYASKGNRYSDVEFEINPDGSYTSRYWFDEERLYKEEYDSAMLVAKDFPHAEANSLVNHQLAYKQKFKRKFERIVLTYWIENELPYFELYSINKKNQKLPIELDDEYIKNTNNILKRHYETTNNGILKDVWKPWNKIVLSIPPNSYLDENEDIAYYLDDVKLEKDFFLIGY